MYIETGISWRTLLNFKSSLLQQSFCRLQYELCRGKKAAEWSLGTRLLLDNLRAINVHSDSNHD